MPALTNALCHKDRPHHRGGLCAECYPKRWEPIGRIVRARREWERLRFADWYSQNAVYKRSASKRYYEAKRDARLAEERGEGPHLSVVELPKGGAGHGPTGVL